jgi:hypothetical protein
VADFCQQCCYELFGRDTQDLAVPNGPSTARYFNLCETCGSVTTDARGRRVDPENWLGINETKEGQDAID